MRSNKSEDKGYRLADAFLKVPQYKPYFDALEDSPLAKVRPISNTDVVILGKQFRQFEQYKRMVNEIGTIRDLGQLPKYAYDVITANYAASIIPLLSSVQPIPSQQGLVYFKQIKARTTRGTVTTGQILRNATEAPEVQAVGFAGEHVVQNLGLLNAGQQIYNFNLTPAPVRERQVTIKLSKYPTQKLIDDGEGNLVPSGGALATGIINYSTGLCTVEFIPVIDGTETASAEFATDFEESGNLPTVQSGYDSTDVRAELFAIRSEMGMMKMYELKKTFGKEGETEMINDLTQEINAELGNTLISRMAAASFGTPIVWNSAHDAGISEVEHKMAFRNRISEAESKIYRAAGRGQVTAIVCGAKASQLFDQLGGVFEKIGFASSGPTLYGMYNKNTPVIRAIDVVGDSDVYCIYKGTGNFDAPAVYCPYMPLVVNGSLPVLNNVMKHQAFAAVWSAMRVVVNRFITKIEIGGLV